MPEARYRAWRFEHPMIVSDGATSVVDGTERERPVVGAVLSPTGGIAMVSEAASVRQALLILLTTNPGERVMRPEYGCDLRRLVFSPNDATTAGLAIHYVRSAVERWEPRAEVLRVDAAPHPEIPERLDVELEYRVRPSRERDRILLPLHLGGES